MAGPSDQGEPVGTLPQLVRRDLLQACLTRDLEDRLANALGAKPPACPDWRCVRLAAGQAWRESNHARFAFGPRGSVS